MISMKIIGHIHCDFPTKFGIPRQSGLVEEMKGKIILEEEYRNREAFRGLEEYSHIWLVWMFSESVREGWSPTVRPPKLGGNIRMGVFATRSPFRPNPIGLSSVRLERIEYHPVYGPVLHIAGADLMNGTPILDIKPYLPYVDSHPQATGGFTDRLKMTALQIQDPKMLLDELSEEKRAALVKVLEQDPRPSYQQDPKRIYGFPFAGRDVRFRVDGEILYITDIIKL